MTAWLCIPSARPVDQVEPVLVQWKSQGYKIALWRDLPQPLSAIIKSSDLIMVGAEYPGYAKAVNMLVKEVMRIDSAAEFMIAAGDDTLPDPTKTAEEIARECSEHFYNAVELSYPPSRKPWAEIPLPSAGGSGKDAPSWKRWSTFGVCQPTGDRWHEGCGGFTNAPIDRVCGSPWLGREFCRRMYGGTGPYFPGYKHMFLDEELQEVAIKLGVLWQRRDLTHRHNHWGRGATDKTIVNNPVIPAHLEKWNTREHWIESRALFASRKARGFPGHEPIA